jgi:primosomal protein N' (replication factor Y)
MTATRIANQESVAFAEVALDVPLRVGDRVFTFGVPQALQSRIAVGTPVRVPFGRHTSVGFVVKLAGQSMRPVRPIAAVEERLHVLPSDLVDLAWWMAEYHACSVGAAVAAMLPPLAAGLRKRSDDPGGLVHPDRAVPDAAPGPTGIVGQLSAAHPATVAVVGEDARFDVYAEALRWAATGHLGTIVLVPEIAQAVRMAAWVARRVQLPVALLAGHLSDQQRWHVWQRILIGDISMVVGTRLAIFAPVSRLGLIIVDHEEDTSYKEEREPRYHARRVAAERARLANASTIWGTPAPSLEVVLAIRTGAAATVTVPPPQRPSIVLSDVRAEVGPLGGVFGRRLYQVLARVLPRGRAIIFVPRRGYADFLLCHECGWVPRCPRCGVALTYHVGRSRAAVGRDRAQSVDLRCHLCGRTESVPEVCAVCQGASLRPHGVGTERVERAARKLFRASPLMRLDTDAAPDDSSQARVWRQFERRGGLLIGTQLLIKGVGQVHAAVVGAVGVDAGLHLPDFRAAERMHQVLTRLTRLADQEMIIQTYSPTHPALIALAKQDSTKFYESELASRERFGYPPFRSLINLVVTGPHEDAVQAVAGRLAEGLAGTGEVLGPSPAPISRLRGRSRWQLLVKEQPEHAARRTLARLLVEAKFPRDVKVVVDVDPLDML